MQSCSWHPAASQPASLQPAAEPDSDGAETENTHACVTCAARYIQVVYTNLVITACILRTPGAMQIPSYGMCRVAGGAGLAALLVQYIRFR